MRVTRSRLKHTVDSAARLSPSSRKNSSQKWKTVFTPQPASRKLTFLVHVCFFFEYYFNRGSKNRKMDKNRNECTIHPRWIMQSICSKPDSYNWLPTQLSPKISQADIFTHHNDFGWNQQVIAVFATKVYGFTTLSSSHHFSIKTFLYRSWDLKKIGRIVFRNDLWCSHRMETTFFSALWIGWQIMAAQMSSFEMEESVLFEDKLQQKLCSFLDENFSEDLSNVRHCLERIEKQRNVLENQVCCNLFRGNSMQTHWSKCFRDCKNR